MTTTRFASVLCVLCLEIACGSGGPSTPAGPTGTPSATSTSTTTTTIPPAPTQGTNPAVMGSMTARIDGSSFSAVNLAHAVLADTAAVPTLVIQGWGPASTPQINLLVQPRLGTVNIVAPNLSFITIATLSTASGVWSASQAKPASSGTVTITALRPRVVGTFEFVALSDGGVSPASRRITEGRFDIQACDPPCLFDPVK